MFISPYTFIKFQEIFHHTCLYAPTRLLEMGEYVLGDSTNWKPNENSRHFGINLQNKIRITIRNQMKPSKTNK